ncbi:hypothetical protein AB833_02565 [Chromatiales bacterium (ex Bugula neritina AB1)]|nr:hypothetical protein AB833_02565 [Chromatiales bacterium (ex Bugula neritina AB1)]
MTVFWKRGNTEAMFELSEEEQLEERAIELTEKLLKGKRVDVARREIFWSMDMGLSICQCAKKIEETGKPEQAMSTEMIEQAIMGWLDMGEYYLDGLTEDQEGELDDAVWEWIESHNEGS